MHNQKKDNNQFKNHKQPEVPENQTAWESDKELKKHSSRLVGGAEMHSPGEEDAWYGKAVDHMDDPTFAHK